jgi:hypothetical protein
MRSINLVNSLLRTDIMPFPVTDILLLLSRSVFTFTRLIKKGEMGYFSYPYMEKCKCLYILRKSA